MRPPAAPPETQQPQRAATGTRCSATGHRRVAFPLLALFLLIAGFLSIEGNFYWRGHCGELVINPGNPTDGPGESLSFAEIGQALNNGQEPYWVFFKKKLYNSHPYQLVILDGCAALNANWTEAFGMPFTGRISKKQLKGTDPSALLAFTNVHHPRQQFTRDADVYAAYQLAQYALFHSWYFGLPLDYCRYNFNRVLTNPQYNNHYWQYVENDFRAALI